MSVGPSLPCELGSSVHWPLVLSSGGSSLLGSARGDAAERVVAGLVPEPSPHFSELPASRRSDIPPHSTVSSLLSRAGAQTACSWTAAPWPPCPALAACRGSVSLTHAGGPASAYLFVSPVPSFT